MGADAAGEAIDAALAKGVPVTGLIADDKGELKLARRYADGSIEWIEEAPSSANGEMGLYYKGTTDNVLYNYVNPVDVVDISDKEHLFAELVTTDAFCRLSDVRFLGGIDYLLVPVPNGSRTNTRYTRYQHSLGVASLAMLYADMRELSEQDRRLAYAAALLHDIGHAPLSHSLEPVFEEAFGVNHHQATEDIIMGRVELGKDVNKVLRRYRVDPERLVAVLAGEDDPFEGFFAGPINFDTIEAVLRSKQYMNPSLVGQNPIAVARAAINRSTKTDRDVIDSFWNDKNDVYKLIVRSRDGVLADNFCQHLARRVLNKLSVNDYFSTEKQIFRKIPELRAGLTMDLSNYRKYTAVDEPVRYKLRRFYVDKDSSFFTRDDHSRYRQSKQDRILIVAAPRQSGRDWSEWDLFDESSIPPFETVF